MSVPAPHHRNMLAIITDPEPYLHLLSEHISSGGTLAEFAKAWGLPYGTLSAWITDDEDRRAAYLTAITLRDEYLCDIVIRQLRSMCDANMSGAFDDDGNMLPVKKMPIDVQRSIVAIEIGETRHGLNGDDLETTTKRIRLVDPSKAVELLGKYRKMFTEKIEHTGDVRVNVIDYDPEVKGR